MLDVALRAGIRILQAQWAVEQRRGQQFGLTPPSDREMEEVYAKLNNCRNKAVALSLIDPYADQFIDESRRLPTISELFQTKNLDLQYPELLKLCTNITINISEDHINKVAVNSRTQANGSGFYRHRAGRIGASVSSAVFHTNFAQPSQSLIRTICYQAFTRSILKQSGMVKSTSDAIKAYEVAVKANHANLEVKKCGLFVNKGKAFLYATPDFLVSCSCCGNGCGEVKCPFIIDGNFEDYIQQKNSCLEKVNGHFQLKKTHSYYFQVQQQLFSVPNVKYCDFVVCAIDKMKNIHLVVQCIYPDIEHWNRVLPKLEIFWTICILPEILGRWYTRRCTVPVKLPDKDAICFCRMKRDEESILCSNEECPPESVKATVSPDSKSSLASSRAQRAKIKAAKAALVPQQAEERSRKMVELEVKRVEMEI